MAEEHIPTEGLNDHDQEMMEVHDEEAAPTSAPQERGGILGAIDRNSRRYRESHGLNPDSKRPVWMDLMSRGIDREGQKWGAKPGEPIAKAALMRGLEKLGLKKREAGPEQKPPTEPK